jgi:hypothetical protein
MGYHKDDDADPESEISKRLRRPVEAFTFFGE